jgi:hypothetical protein
MLRYPLEMVFRAGRDAARRVHVKIAVQMQVYVIQHPLHPGMVVLEGGFILSAGGKEAVDRSRDFGMGRGMALLCGHLACSM